MGELILNVAVIGAVGVASVTDVRARRIPNRLTLTILLAGLGLNAAFFGADGLLSSGAGSMVGLGLLLPLFLLGGLGAGDVKLLAALGALKGPEFAFFTCLWAGVVGGAMALLGLLRSRKLGLALGNLALGLLHLLHFRMNPFDAKDGSLISAGRFPYAPAIAIGAIAVMGGARWMVV